MVTAPQEFITNEFNNREEKILPSQSPDLKNEHGIGDCAEEE
ncbi:12278_t:CDS:2 [Entrophospora sp. SA101]|nr:12278_t:CDS:2 [Entrophospora sp. SA101]